MASTPRSAMHRRAPRAAGALAALVLPWSAGCAGVSIGDDGEADDGVECVAEGVDVADPAAPLDGFEQTPEALLSPAADRLEGALELASGGQSPLAVTLRPDVETLRAFVPEGDSANPPGCTPWLELDVVAELEVGEQLRGQTAGLLLVRGGRLQVRGEWMPLSELAVAPEPAFERELVEGPYLLAYLLQTDDARWEVELELAARVVAEPCGATTEMCSGGPAGWEPEYVPFGQGVLHPVP